MLQSYKRVLKNQEMLDAESMTELPAGFPPCLCVSSATPRPAFVFFYFDVTSATATSPTICNDLADSLSIVSPCVWCGG